MVLRDFFNSLAQNEALNTTAKNYGFKLGAGHIVAGTNLQEAIESVRALNVQGISCTIDYLGEFVSEEAIAIQTKEAIFALIDAIHKEELNAHISLKPTQLGLDIDIDFCYDHLREIVEHADEYGIFVNIDTEDSPHLQVTFDMVEELQKVFNNVGTVIQANLHRAKNDIEHLKNSRLRIVKGAYKETDEMAYQDKLDIDIHFIELIEYHLAHGNFTSIATHDLNMIKHIKYFVEQYNIPKDQFEFQLLYGFHKDLQLELMSEGYQVCVYVPYGEEWYSYAMRHLAKHPQSMSLVTKQMFNKKTNTLLAVTAGAFVLGRLSKKRK